MRYLLLALAIGATAAAPPSEDPSLSPDEGILKAGKVKADGPGVLSSLRTGYTETTDDRIRDLVEQLGDDSWYRREEASARLVGIGIRARRFLEAARRHEDLEIRMRARRCLDKMEDNGRDVLELTAAAIRQLARLKPDGALYVLLESLDAAEDDMIAGEMRAALMTVGVRER